eukprot:503483-Rhodomonas_salina.1
MALAERARGVAGVDVDGFGAREARGEERQDVRPGLGHAGLVPSRAVLRGSTEDCGGSSERCGERSA